MSRRLFALLMAAVLAAVAGGVVPQTSLFAAPEPSLSPISWELTFRHGAFERIFVTVDGKEKAFWYMRYSVVNNSGRDVLFTPQFELVAETGVVLSAFKDIPKEVFPKIKSLHKNDLMLSPTDVYGKLLQGEDNARDSVIIFSDIDPNARNFSLFIKGLSGETAEVKNPVNGKPVILQKTLELDYNIPGQAIGIEPQATLKAAKFVMK